MADTPAPAKRTYRVAARSRPHLTADTFSNLAARLGVGPEQANLQAASTYTANPITRNRQLLEFAYRGLWFKAKNPLIRTAWAAFGRPFYLSTLGQVRTSKCLITQARRKPPRRAVQHQTQLG